MAVTIKTRMSFRPPGCGFQVAEGYPAPLPLPTFGYGPFISHGRSADNPRTLAAAVPRTRDSSVRTHVRYRVSFVLILDKAAPVLLVRFVPGPVRVPCLGRQDVLPPRGDCSVRLLLCLPAVLVRGEASRKPRRAAR